MSCHVISCHITSSNVIISLFCFFISSDMRTQDPENDFFLNQKKGDVATQSFTNNWVRNQRGYPAYQHPTIPNAAVVCSCGSMDYNSLVCLGNVHPTGVVSHSTVLASPALVATNTIWKSYGGKDVVNKAQYASRMRYYDDQPAAAVAIGTLAPGEVTTFSYMNVMHNDQMLKALTTVAAVTIVQPTVIMTGSAAPFTVGTWCGVLLRNAKHSIVLHCIVLYCIVLYCIVLYCIVLYCIVQSRLPYCVM